MRVLYIEDDSIDIIAFKRLAEKLNVEYTILHSMSEVEEHFTKPRIYDLIISDFYLNESNANDFIHYFNDFNVSLISSKEKINSLVNTTNFQFIEKPLNENAFTNRTKIITLDLTYFNELAGDDMQFKIEMFDVALKSLSESICKLQEIIILKDFEKIKFEVHKMKSGIRVFGANMISEISYAECIALEKNEKELFPILENIISNTKITIDLIKEEKNKL